MHIAHVFSLIFVVFITNILLLLTTFLLYIILINSHVSLTYNT